MYRLLVVEDNPGDVRLVRALLAESSLRRFDIENAERLADALDRLGRGGIDVVLLDLSLPDSVGVGTVEAVCAQAAGVPVVAYTGLGDEAKGAEALRKGAANYVVKGRPGTGPLLSQILADAVERRRVRAVADEASRRLERLIRHLRAGQPSREDVQAALAEAESALDLLRGVTQ